MMEAGEMSRWKVLVEEEEIRQREHRGVKGLSSH